MVSLSGVYVVRFCLRGCWCWW